jgi:UDP-N-acetylmuramate--alanine ligase
MNIKKIRNIYFLGIGGMGMSSLARYFKSIGKNVRGYDKNSTSLTKEMEKEGISIIYNNNYKFLPNFFKKENKLIIYTPAISKHDNIWKFFLKKKYLIKKRSEILGNITKNNFCIAIAGTHGKTTITAIVAHILYNSNIEINAFLGGISENYNSNFISNGNKISVVEADEFDYSFLTLSPNISCITSIEKDHFDTYNKKKKLKKSFLNFSKKLKPGGILILNKNISLKRKKFITYSLLKKSDYYSNNFFLKKGKYFFDFHLPNKKIFKSICLPKSLLGKYNLENVTAALTIVVQLGINEKNIKKHLYSFKGVKRRFSIHFFSKKKIYIDDYAHHPTEISCILNTVRDLFPNKKILTIFQPHLFSRTIFLAKDFSKSLEKSDSLIILDIYPAREKPIKKINSSILLKNINIKEKELSNLINVLDTIKKKKFDILITLGAGNIDTLVIPITKWMKKYFHN